MKPRPSEDLLLTLLADIDDLIIQATHERSHYYVKSILVRCREYLTRPKPSVKWPEKRELCRDTWHGGGQDHTTPFPRSCPSCQGIHSNFKIACDEEFNNAIDACQVAVVEAAWEPDQLYLANVTDKPVPIHQFKERISDGKKLNPDTNEAAGVEYGLDEADIKNIRFIRDLIDNMIYKGHIILHEEKAPMIKALDNVIKLAERELITRKEK